MVLVRHSGTWTGLCASSSWAGARWPQHCPGVGSVHGLGSTGCAPRAQAAPQIAHRPPRVATCYDAPRSSTQVVGVLKGYDALLNLVRACPRAERPTDRRVLSSDDARGRCWTRLRSSSRIPTTRTSCSTSRGPWASRSAVAPRSCLCAPPTGTRRSRTPSCKTRRRTSL